MIKTVGTGGDFATLVDAWAWASGQRFAGASDFLEIELLAGDHYADNITLRHIDASAITIKGQPRTASVPTIGDMTGYRATDLANVSAIYPSRLHVSGLHTYGIQFPSGLKLIKDLLIVSVARYTIAVGEFGPSTRTAAGGSLSLDGVTIFGGVWGLMALRAWITNSSQNAFLYQDVAESGWSVGGGPLYLYGSTLRSMGGPTYRLDMFSLNSLYGMWCENSNVYGDNTLHFARAGVGIHAFGSNIAATGSEFNRCRGVAFSQRGSFVNLWNSTATACDARTGDSPMEFWPGYVGSFGALIGVGAGSTINLQDMTFNGCAAKYGIAATGGKAVGFGINFIECDLQTEGILMENSQSYLRYNHVSPTPGSKTTFVSNAASSIG